MSRNAKLFVAVLLALGACVFAVSFAEWRPEDLTKFLSILLLAVCASGLRVVLPKMAGEISLSLMFVMIGIVDLPLAETLLVGCTTLLIESVWKPGVRPSALQILFAVGNMSVAIACSAAVFRSTFLFEQRVELPFRILIGATTCFVANSFAVAAVTALNERVSLLKQWQEKALPRYPQYVLAGLVAWAYSLVKFEVGWPAGLLILPVLYLLQRTYSLYLGRLEDGKVHAEELASLHLRTIEALAGAIEAKDNNTHNHLKRVQVYAVEIGREMGLHELELKALQTAAVLHDIGKLAVPEHIISKPGRLTPEEFEKMKIHPVVGAEILERVQFPYPVAPLVRAHHERWDGAGYPLGLRGTDIPVGARILAAVDCLDALASDRQYRRALPLHEAMERVACDSGTAFDPDVVAILKRRYVELEQKARASSRAGAMAPLSRDLKIENSAAPAAGFALAKPVVGMHLVRRPVPQSPLEALTAARREMLNAFDATQPDGKPLGFTEALSLFAVRLKRVLPFDALALYFVRDGVLAPDFVFGDNYRLFSSLRIPVGQGLSGWVAEHREAILNGNPSVEPGYLNDPKIFSTLGSALAVPLEDGPTVVAVFALYRDARDSFTHAELAIVQALAPRLAVAAEKACLESVLESESEMDASTGFPGPRMLLKQLDSELTRSKRLSTPVTLLLCRVDGLQAIKETHGAAEANKALRALASAFKDQAHGYDFLARCGPAEFAVVSPGMNRMGAEARIARLAHVTTTHGAHTLRLVIGYAHSPDDGFKPEDLFAAADARLASALRVPVTPPEARAAVLG